MINLDQYKKPTDMEIEQALKNAVNQVETNLESFTYKFKVDGTTNNFYTPSDNISWTSGFWTGQIWLAYEITEKDKFKNAAEIQVDSFLHRIENKIQINHHDMGFLYSLSCVAAYKLTKNEKAKKAAILAADNLISRYRKDGKFIQAWGNIGAEDNYRLIIDCLLNLPLLYWASNVTGDTKYANTATEHINTSLKVIMRKDHSTYHTYYFEKGTGKPLYGETRQGYSNNSAWSRGQAWGIYGTALSYMYTKNNDYLNKFYKITDFFIEHLPNDLVPYWDFEFSDGSNEPKDSSAAAIAVCGMLEMSKYLDKEKSNYYIGVALKILKSLINNYAVSNSNISNGQLLHGVYARKSIYNGNNNRNVNECNTWGDYFYMEALIRATRNWKLYW
ncbi:MAG: glycoside hydrolase family 88 protein [Vallitalea sp.]|jgi:unsaturated chondroitin disaccharide hydrolase|nr:glycoside hydrolase family 88 protein [Vallitalea sp.]